VVVPGDIVAVVLINVGAVVFSDFVAAVRVDVVVVLSDVVAVVLSNAEVVVHGDVEAAAVPHVVYAVFRDAVMFYI